MKMSREVPVTAFQGGEGLLPAYQRLVREKVIPYQYQVLEDKLEGVEKSHALENLRLAAQKNRGEALSGEEGEELLPTRQDLAALYRKLASLKGAAFGLQSLLGALPGFNLGKLLLCLEMLQERRLIALLGGEQRKTAELLPTQGKVDIFASPVYGRAKQLAEN